MSDAPSHPDRAGAAWITDTLWPGATISSDHVRGAAARLVAIPHASSPTQLLPVSPASVVAVSQRHSDDRPRSKSLRDAAAVGALVAAARFDRRRRVTVVGDAGASLVAHLRREIDPSISNAVVLCGPARANRKPVLQLHDRWGRTVAYAKVAWNPLTRALLQHEGESLAHLAGTAGTSLQVPRVLGAGQFAGADWLALGPVGVERRARPTESTTFDVARAIERTAAEWRGSIDDNPFVAAVAAGADGLALAGAAVEALVAQPGAADLVLRAAHGDFVPWNILSGAPAPAVWDWERYQRAAPVGFDRFHHAFQVAIFRQGVAVDDAIGRIDRRLGDIVPELPRAAAGHHLDWYLADLLSRYERDATSGDGGTHVDAGLMARARAMATVLEQRRSSG